MPASVPESHRPVPAPVLWSLIAVLCLVWGSTWWAIRVCLRDQPPLSAAALRFVLAGAVMSLFVRARRRFDTAPPPPAWLWLATGITSFAGSYGILYCAEESVPSGLAAVLWAIFPLLMAISSVLFLGERLRPLQLAGFVVCFGGITIVFAGDLLGGGEPGHDLAGSALLLLASPLVSATGTTLVKRFGRDTSSLLLNRNGMLFGALLLSIAAFLREDPLAMVWTWRSTVTTLYLSLFGTAMTFAPAATSRRTISPTVTGSVP